MPCLAGVGGHSAIWMIALALALSQAILGALPAGVHTVDILCVNNVLGGPLEALGHLGLLFLGGCRRESFYTTALPNLLRSSPSFIQMSSRACEGLGPLAVTGRRSRLGIGWLKHELAKQLQQTQSH